MVASLTASQGRWGAMAARHADDCGSTAIRSLRLVLACLIACLTMFPALGATQSCPEFPFFPPQESPATPLNCDFHKRYEDRIVQTIASFGAPGGRPVILVLGESMQLRWRGARETVNALPPGYHAIKAFSHTTFAVLLALHETSPGSISPSFVVRLEEQRQHVQEALAGMPALPLSPEAAATAQAIAQQTIALLTRVIADRAWSGEQLNAYYQTARPFILRAFTLAAQLQLDALDTSVSRWLARLSAEERVRLGVVVASAHQARAGAITMQYFERKLGKPTGVGAQREDGLVLLEGKFDEHAALALLARHYVDRDAALVILRDPTRLQRDALSDAGAQYLQTLIPEPASMEATILGVPDQPDTAGFVAQVGQPFQAAIPLSNMPLKIVQTHGHFPPGVALNWQTGLFSGVPETAGIYIVEIRSENRIGWSAPTSITIEVVP